VLSTRPRLTDFVAATCSFTLDRWQEVLCDRLELLCVQRGQRILIHAPPQWGKSFLISQRFPAYYLGRNPAGRVKLACYNITHATRFGAVCYSLTQGRDFRALFPKAFVPPRQSREEWSTLMRKRLDDGQPSFAALGLETGFVGQGASLLVIDDPYKSPQDAASEAIRERVWTFWDESARVRLTADANVVVMFHRYNEADLAGRLMETEGLQKDGGKWELMRFAAIADGHGDDPMDRPVGAKLSPRMTDKYLAEQQASGFAWDGQFQGLPGRKGGNLFEVDRLQIVPAAPAIARRCRGWDQACLVAGTLVETVSGPKPIESIKAGELVLTRRGYREVEWSGKTKNVTEIVSVLFANGSIVSGTADHRVWTGNRGWVALKFLAATDRVVTYREGISPCQDCQETAFSRTPKLWSSTEPPTVADRASGTSRGGYCWAAARCGTSCTGQSGGPHTATFPLAMIFTTRTATGTTTRLTILSASASQNMPADTPKNRHTSKILRCGRRPLRAWLGGVQTILRSGSRIAGGAVRSRPHGLKAACMSASSVGRNLSLGRSGRGFCSVLSCVRDADALPDCIPRLAPCARLSSLLRSLERSAARQAVELNSVGAVPVYDLTVRDQHEFFANGILVHNSLEGAGDFTVGVRVSKAPDGIWYIEDVVRGQWDTAARNRTIVQTAEMDGHSCLIAGEQEPGSGGKDQARNFIKMLAGYNVQVWPASSAGSKVVKADPLSAQVNAGNVRLVKGPWNNQLIQEFRAFPLGKTDDVVDGAATAFNRLARRVTVQAS
jgi:predicted phage terminase large subunit-like protein